MDGSFWVFAYGSLIWQPGFEFAEVRKATLSGWHRAMCILSTHYRGSAETPGLVLGLDHGGSCRGLAYRIAEDKVESVRGYLQEREMVSGVYVPKFIRLRLQDGRDVRGYVFVARRDHKQYAGSLPPERAAQLIHQGRGSTGSSRDYLASTVAHLDRLGLHDKALRRLLDLVDGGRNPVQAVR
ncbi:gamma-glutamylcyclotransferase [Telmatospirillum siberiense]|uniref:glutathione-specific gamma-glutamylcyclotransferase n=1 Tax=Telmatospirillum siberiense TaxID=382514 RepID=A0A2N3Q0K2_9PROT|nr:gamma-glutamylcyclotransferase [Telmatospirillum siberiense]PKU26189.1 gamma-glutamylcyclotransferase [Telmatospirillum siberiense]